MLDSHGEPYNVVDDNLVSEDGHVIDARSAGPVDELFLLADPPPPSLQRPDVDRTIAVTGDRVGLVV